MISCSEAFKAKINNGDIPLVRMQLITASGRTFTIEDGQFWGNSISFSHATSQDGAFTVGSAVIGGFNFALTNFDRTFDNVDFSGAVVVPLLYFDIDGTREYLAKGIYYITSHVTSGNIIRCQAMDGLKLLDQSRTSITYPTTVQALVEAICTANNLTLDTVTIPNGNFALQAPTDSTGEPIQMTDRQMLSYACQCIGCFAQMNENGHLEIRWYDFENPVNLATTFDGKSLWTEPIFVTGLRVGLGNGSGALMAMSVDAYGNVVYMRSSNVSDTFAINSNGELIATADSGVTYQIVNEELIRTGEEIVAPEDTDTTESIDILYGTDDRVIKIGDNPYITQTNVVSVCEIVSNKIFGIAFRPGSLPILANPCLEAGDVLSVTDRLANFTYLFPVTSTVYNKQITQTAVCAFEDKEDNDLRPSSSYNMSVSVDNAIRQAQQADELARAAQEMAETSGYQPYIVSDKGTAFNADTTANLTAMIYDQEMNEVDPQGTDYIYRWWITKDGKTSSYLDGGKNITIPVDDDLCDYAAGIYFETKDISEGINPFLLSKRNGVVLTNRSGVPLSVRAAEVYG